MGLIYVLDRLAVGPSDDVVLELLGVDSSLTNDPVLYGAGCSVHLHGICAF